MSLGLVALAFAALLATPAHAAPLTLPKLEKAEGRLVSGPSFVLKARLDPSSRAFDVFVEDRQVTRRFTRKGRMISGRVPLRDLPAGITEVMVRARRGAAVRSEMGYVVKTRRARGMVDIKGRAGKGRVSVTAARPLRIRVRAGRARDTFTARLNGRRIDRRFRYPTKGIRRATLSASDGLRYGRNVLVLTAFREKQGRFDRERVVVRLRRDGPMAGAGIDDTIRTGRRTRLDGRASRPLPRGDRLEYRWEVASAPKGSRPRLLRPSSARPVLRTRVDGRYRVRLTVSTRGAARRVRARDSIVLASQGAIGPLGVPISTSVTQNGQPGLLLDDTFYPLPPPFPDNKLWLALIDRCTGTLDSFTSQSEDQLVTTIDSLQLGGLCPDAGQIAVLMGYGEYDAEINDLMSAIGGEPLKFPSSGNYTGNFAFSVIGVRGMPQGQAMTGQAPDDANPTPEAPWNVSGYLQPVGPDGYLTFNAGQYVPFALNTTSASQLLIQVGACTRGTGCYASIGGGLPSGQSGFALVALDPDDLSNVNSGALATNGTADDAAAQQQVADFINQAAAGGDLLFMVPIGTPKPTTPTWTAISDAIAAIGGNPDLLNSSSGYAFVGGVGLESKEYVPVAGNPFNVAGLLVRDENYHFGEYRSDPLGTFDYTLEQVAYASTAGTWPYQKEDWYEAAQTYFAAGGRLDLDLTNVSDIRDNYWYYPSTDWDAESNELDSNIDCDEVDLSTDGFTSTECGLLKTQLAKEFPLVAQAQGVVAAKLTGFKEPILDTSETTYADLQCIANNIELAVAPPSGSNAVSTGLEIAEDVLYTLSSVAALFAAPAPGAAAPPASASSNSCQNSDPTLLPPPPNPPDPPNGGGNIFGPTSSALGALGGALALASVFTQDSSGSNALQEAVSVAADDLGVTLANQYSDDLQALDQVFGMLVRDWQTLQVSGPNFSNGIWSWSDAADTHAVWGIALGTRQHVYSSLMPVAYQALDAGARTSLDGCLGVFREPQNGSLLRTVGFQGSPGSVTPIPDMWAITERRELDELPPESLLQNLFTPFNTSSTAVNTDVQGGFSPAQFYYDTMNPPAGKVPC